MDGVNYFSFMMLTLTIQTSTLKI